MGATAATGTETGSTTDADPASASSFLSFSTISFNKILPINYILHITWWRLSLATSTPVGIVFMAAFM
jgi:hypothetical protein